MKKILITIALALALLSCGKSSKKSTSKDVTITGAGASFPLPFYKLAFKTYSKKAGIDISYGGIGSGGGIRSLKDKIVDFGATDAFLSDEKMKTMPSPIVHVPTCLGAVVLAFNIDGITELNLTPDVLSSIFLGEISKWNDKKIAAINKGIKLPDLAITVVYRSDGSGTTYVFTDYLSKISKEWKESIGCAKSLRWPIGIAAKGNPGVAGTISNTKGAIGYIGSEYAFSLKISTAAIANKSGIFTKASVKSITASANVDIKEDTRVMLTNSEAKEAYPISCFTWIIIYKDQAYSDRTIANAQACIKLLNWMLDDKAQALTTKVHYAPLPTKARERARAILKTITFNGERVAL
jgi:phosphate transport system substrate-binding protein